MGALRVLNVGDKVEVVIDRVTKSRYGIASCPSWWSSTGDILVDGDVEAGETVTAELIEDGSRPKASPVDSHSFGSDTKVYSAVEFCERVQKIKEEREATEEAAAEEMSLKSVPSQDVGLDRNEELMQKLRVERLARERANKDDSDDGSENLNELLKGDM